MAELVQLVKQDGEAPQPMSVGRACWSIGLFAIAFLTAAAVNRVVLPQLEPDDMLRMKLADFAQRKDEFDTLVIGSSRIHRQFVPATFTGEAAALGASRRPYNFGVPGMQGIETERALAAALRVAGNRLRWVIIDPGVLESPIDAENLGSPRVVFWHDLAGTINSVQLAMDVEPSLAAKCGRALGHLQMGAMHLANVGGAYRQIEEMLAPASSSQSLEEAGIRSCDGYLSLSEHLESSHPDFASASKRHQEFLDQRDLFLTKAASLRHKCRLAPNELTDAQRRHVRRLVRMVREAGAEPLFLLAPLDNAKQRYLLSAVRDGEIDRVANFLDPERYPHYYEIAMRFDLGHLNHAGAERFSEELARVLFAPTGTLAAPAAESMRR